MKKLKSNLIKLLLCLTLLFSIPVTNIYASNTAEISYKASRNVMIDKGDGEDTGGNDNKRVFNPLKPIKTGDETELYNLFIIFSFSALSLFFIIAFKRRKEEENEFKEIY